MNCLADCKVSLFVIEVVDFFVLGEKLAVLTNFVSLIIQLTFFKE
jgi:hypothetical protein